MQEELSMHSYVKIFNPIEEESSVSYSNNYSSQQAKKRQRAHEDKIVCLPRFKGVVPQQNGNWGAQIYANHQRIWLGTFKSESDAAKAYDSAAIKLRGRDSDRNFPLTNFTLLEPIFQSRYTVEEILNLIKDGSYPSKFAHFLSQRRSDGGELIDINLGKVLVHGSGCRLLFQKELTPSDVGKLNRLVIPKKYAVKYFPYIGESEEEEEEEENVDSSSVEMVGGDVQLGFYDKVMRLWKFRYCYWKSSQSYVFTRGWNRFVKEKELKANDTVAFYAYELHHPNDDERKTFYVIDVGHKGAGGFEQINLNYGLFFKEERSDSEENIEKQSVVVGSSSGKKGFKLFGVQII